MPRPKRSNKTRERFIISDAQLTAHRGAADAGAKLIDIDTVGIDDDFFCRPAGLNKIPTFDFRDHENARCRREIQTLASLEQFARTQATPMLRHPNFGSVVFQKQRTPRG